MEEKQKTKITSRRDEREEWKEREEQNQRGKNRSNGGKEKAILSNESESTNDE